MANRNFSNGGKFYTMHVKPVIADCKFTVTVANASGVTSVKGPLIANVFGHTSNGSPASYKGITNKLPAGYFQIFFADNYNIFLNMSKSIATQLSGSSLAVATDGVTSANVYVITAVGTTSQAQWQSIGLPAGVTPAVGCAFVASKTGTATGTGTVQAPATNGPKIGAIEVVGDPTQTMANQAQPTNGGGYIIIRTMSATDSTTTTPIATQPPDNTQLQLAFYINDSSVPS